MGKFKILIVEDEEDIREALKICLESEGFVCATAATGTDALIVASTFVPDLVMLDLNLPGYDGTEVCLRIKNDPQTQHTKVLMLSARDSRQDVFLGSQVGADMYMTKPFEMANVLVNVGLLLGRAPSER